MSLIRYTEHNGACCAPRGGKEIVHVDCASHVYPDGTKGIHDMCFSVCDREIVALCGGNGSGKSTLIEHLNGLLLPSKGSVEVLGKKLDKDVQKHIWKDVGVVFQRSEDQLFAPTVMDDVMFGPLNLGMSVPDAKKAAEDALEAVGAGDIGQKLPSYLSGGQKRLVSIAGILAMRPRVIALDEPTSDLDLVHASIIEGIIRDLRDRHGISVVIATHDLDMAARLADRICIVKKGSLIAEGLPEDIFYDATVLEEAGLRKPDIVRIYESLCAGLGIAPDHRPVSAEQLICCITGVKNK